MLDLLYLRFLRYLLPVFLTRKKNPCYFCVFAIFADISGSFLASFVSKSWFLLHLLFSRFLRYLLPVFLTNKKNLCYFLRFLRYLLTFRGPSWLLFLYVLIPVTFILLFLWFLGYSVLVTGVFSWQEKSLLLLRFLRYLLPVFLANKKNPCYFCDICGHFGAPLGFFFF